MRRKPTAARQIAAYAKNLFEIFHRDRLPIPNMVEMTQDPRGFAGVPLLHCKFQDRTETWETVLDGDIIIGWRRKETVPVA